jgi:hypothetical protein
MGRIVRYRECRHCGRRITTYEVPPSMLANPSALGPEERPGLTHMAQSDAGGGNALGGHRNR